MLEDSISSLTRIRSIVECCKCKSGMVTMHTHVKDLSSIFDVNLITIGGVYETLKYQ